MKITGLIVCLCLGCGLHAQDQATSVQVDSTAAVQTPAELSKLEKKIVKLNKQLEAAMAHREELRQKADASTEPEAYSEVATASIKISKLQNKINYLKTQLASKKYRQQSKDQKSSKKKRNQP